MKKFICTLLIITYYLSYTAGICLSAHYLCKFIDVKHSGIFEYPILSFPVFITILFVICGAVIADAKTGISKMLN